MMHRGEECLKKLIVVGNTEGKRQRGCVLTRWTDQMKKIIVQILENRK